MALRKKCETNIKNVNFKLVPGKAEQESTPLKKDENDQSIDVQEDMTGFTDINYL